MVENAVPAGGPQLCVMSCFRTLRFSYFFLHSDVEKWNSLFFSNLYFWVKLDGQLLADKFKDDIGAAQQAARLDPSNK